MAPQVVFIKKDQATAAIVCPSCRNARDVSIQSFRGKHQLKAKCPCGAIFDLKLEFRGKYRKKTNLEGFYLQALAGSTAGRVRMDSTTLNPQSVNCRINNISAHGLGFTTIYRHNIQPGDTLRIVFTLDNSARTTKAKSLLVRNVRDKYIGCEFAESDKNDTDIKFYLL